MPTEAKIRWVEALAKAGLIEIEVGSFVPPKLLPQMADTEEVVRAALRIPKITVLTLAPNLKGAELAFAAGSQTIPMPVSASRAHSLSNVRKTPEQAVDEVRNVRKLCDGLSPERRPRLEVGIATAFGCSIQGEINLRVLLI